MGGDDQLTSGCQRLEDHKTLQSGGLMVERQAGIVVMGDTVTVVDAEVPQDANQPITIVADTSWTLQAGERSAAYDILFKRCANFLRENGLKRVVVKASSTTRSPASLAHLESAELRGVVIAAAASVVQVKTVPKSQISRHYGDRKVDEYLKDDSFWAAQTIGGKLRKTSREAAMMIIAARD